MSGARVIPVKVAGGAYDITVEPGLLKRLGPLVAATTGGGRALVAIDERIAADHGQAAVQSLSAAGLSPLTVTLRAAEAEKTLQAVERIYRAMLGDGEGGGLERDSPVIAVGGGIVGDTAGFAAATFHRGVPLIQVPTTLLAMVDAAIGGKTGVNFPLPGGGLGKNIIGAFWQPRAVLADTDVLGTLDPRDFRCGLAECVKAALIADAGLLDYVSANVEAILERRAETLVELIERSARIKVAIVEADERETGRRAMLNLGHTFAHAIEAQPGIDVRHGEAVALGLVAAAHCARETGRIDGPHEQQIVEILEAMELPTRLAAPVPVDDLVRAMRYDKKVSAGKLRLVLPVGIGATEITEHVPPETVARAWGHLGAKG